jgi:DNA polymerase III alpha subunit (gram-positive type)
LTSINLGNSKSEFVSLKDAPHIVASCFKHPFSQPVIDSSPEEGPRRSIILVGHDVNADINFLRNIGYEVHNLSNLLEVVDTAAMWRYMKREANPRNLGSILAELDIIGWNLHNAGNDAVYTLQAMIGISVKHLNESKKRKETKAIREREKQNRASE